MSKSSGSSGYSAETGRLRARDVDRVTTRARLDIAYEEGQLAADEYHERSERAAAAETLADLHPLVADLQASPESADLSLPDPASLRVRPRAGTYPPTARAREQDRADACLILDAALGDGQLSADDHRALTELAGAAKTLGDLGELTADLQRPADAPAEPRRPRSYRGLFVTGAAVAVVGAAFGGFVATHRSAAEPVVTRAVVPETVQPLVIPTPSPATAEGFALIRDQYRAKFGTTVVDELTLHSEHASLEAAPPGQPNRLARWNYWGGFLASGELTTRPVDTPTFDLAAVDQAVFARLVSEAVEQTRVDGGAVSHINLGPDSSSDAPEITVYVRNKFGESGYLEATPAGDKVRVHPFDR